jgi:hypothetical protein
MKIWSWIEESAPELRQLAVDGGHWMLTPPRTLTLVHAVQQPLIEPQFQDLGSSRTLGNTFAAIEDQFPISGKSTIKVDIHADWQEPVDDLNDKAQPQFVTGSAVAFSTPIEPAMSVARIFGTHEFHDTKHRTVNYQAIATTRFREYFPEAVTVNPDNLTRKSLPVTLSIKSSARPAAPKPLYVIPTFGWETTPEDAWTFSRRSGGGLRVYLQRPWYSSGEGELLGVVLWGCPVPEHQLGQPFEVPEFLRSYVTQWGSDPIWLSPPPPTHAVPREKHFRNTVKFDHGLSLDELPQLPGLAISVAGHEVGYDDDRKLWYCDIEIDQGNAYFPFVRLALARYQPESIPDAHLSRVVLADFAQLAPYRSASIAFDPIDTTSLEVAVSGRTHRGPGSASMVATLEMKAAAAVEAAWVPIAQIPLIASSSPASRTLWLAQVTLPQARGSRPFRLVIEEFEMFPHQHTKRLVYADVLEI